MSAFYKGSSATLANPTKRTERRLRSGVQEVVLELDGLYTDLTTIRDANLPGAALTGYSGVYITDVEVRREGKGDMATMTVNASNAVDPTEFSGGGTQEDIKEVENVPVDQDLRFHKIWDSGTYQISQTDRETIERKLQDPSNDETLSAAAQELYDRLLRGQTHYRQYVPVVRKTTTRGSEPLNLGCGHIDTGAAIAAGGPSQNGNGKSLIYIKTADRKIKQGGRWQRYQEWTGFEKVDNLIVDNT